MNPDEFFGHILEACLVFGITYGALLFILLCINMYFVLI